MNCLKILAVSFPNFETAKRKKKFTQELIILFFFSVEYIKRIYHYSIKKNLVLCDNLIMGNPAHKAYKMSSLLKKHCISNLIKKFLCT